jgi:hypothetical protein
MLLNNNSEYYIKNIKHKISDQLIFKKSIEITDKNTLNNIYDALKYTINFFNKYKIKYLAISGTLIGAVRHNGIIPWDDDFDLLIFKDDFFRLIELVHVFNNKYIKILQISPGFKIFINKKFIGDIFIFDLNSKNKFVASFPYINNTPKNIINKLYFNWINYDINDLLPSNKIMFEDFNINIPNNFQNILKINYPKSNLIECINNLEGKKLHSINNYYFFKILSICEVLLLKLPVIGYIIYYIINIILSLYMKKAYIWF